MAKLLVDEIRETEKQGGEIIAAAEKKAKEIQSCASSNAENELQEKLSDAEQTAAAITKEAKTAAKQMKENVAAEAKTLCDDLRKNAQNNFEAAVDAVVNLLK